MEVNNTLRKYVKEYMEESELTGFFEKRFSIFSNVMKNFEQTESLEGIL